MTRPTMTTLITHVRTLINDPSGGSQQFADSDIQDVLDTTRLDVYNAVLQARITFNGGSIQYLDYLAPLGYWEDDYVLKQYLTVPVTASSVEPLVGHFQFSASTLPPVMLTGKTYDVYRAAADLLARLAARWMLSYNVAVDGQNLQRSGAHKQILAMIREYRLQSRPTSISISRPDLAGTNEYASATLGARSIDYMSSGNGH